MEDKGTNGNGREPVDLRMRRIALEMEREMGGLFGIDRHDIERAIKRLEERVADEHPSDAEALPPFLNRVLPLLEIVHDVARSAQAAGEVGSVRMMIELLENYRGRLERMLESGE